MFTLVVSLVAICEDSTVRVEDRDQGETATASIGTEELEQPRGNAVETTRSDIGPGDCVGRYTIRRLIGEGGMGRVFAAVDPELGRTVAIKLIRSDRAVAPRARARLLREAQALARVRHPNVVSVYDVGTQNDHVFIAMEHVEGATLREWIAAKKRSWREVLGAFIDAGRGLAAAHAEGIVHRDFKPDNVIVGEDRVVVVDFGVARAAADGDDETVEPREMIEATVTLTGEHVGTPVYMAPEQRAGGRVTERADQYAFCVALWEGLHGERPPSKAHRAEVPGWVNAAIERGLSESVEQRWPSMSALLAGLSRDPVRRRRWIIGGTLLGFMIVGAAAFAYQQARTNASLVCSGASEKLDGVWDAPRRQRAQAAFRATGLPNADESIAVSVRALDQYSSKWQAMFTDACRATRVRREQSEELLDLRMSCLEQGRSQLRALADLFTTADAKTVENAAKAAHSLPDLEACTNIAELKSPLPPPRDFATQVRVASVREHLARAEVFKLAGKFPDATSAAAGALVETRTLHYAAVEAEALRLVGNLQDRNGDAKGAESSLRDALVAAAASRHDRETVIAAINLAYVVGDSLGRHQEGQFWAKLALSYVERLGGDDRLRARATRCLGDITGAEGSLKEAHALHQRAVELLQRSAPDTPDFASALNSLGVVYSNLGRYDEALAAHRRSVAVFEKVEGPNHPDVALALNGVGLDLKDLERYDDALRELRRALEIKERAFGPTHPSLATSHSVIATVYRKLGDYDQALEHFRRALELLEKALGPENPRLVATLSGIGKLELDRKRPADAVGPLERALALQQKAGGIAADVAIVKLALARALWDSGNDRRRALELARAARGDGPAADARQEAVQASAEEWLSAHQP